MAGLTRGSMIIGDSSGNPSELTKGSANYVLTSDGTDIAWAAASGGSMSSFQLEDSSGDEVAISDAKEVKFLGEGITTNWTHTDNGTDADPYDLTFSFDAAQTRITSIYASDLILGEDDETSIGFETVNEIHFKANDTLIMGATVNTVQVGTLPQGTLFPNTGMQYGDGAFMLANQKNATSTTMANLNWDRGATNVASGDEGLIKFWIRTDNAAGAAGVGWGANLENSSHGSRSAGLVWYTNVTSSFTKKMQLYASGGLVLGSASDDDMGIGTINAVALYDDGTGVSDYVLEQYANGSFSLDEYNDLVPDREWPDEHDIDGSLTKAAWTEVRTHDAAARFQANAADRFDIDKLDTYFYPLMHLV